MRDRDFLRACGLVALLYAAVILLGGCGGSFEEDPPVTAQPVRCARGACV